MASEDEDDFEEGIENDFEDERDEFAAHLAIPQHRGDSLHCAGLSKRAEKHGKWTRP